MGTDIGSSGSHGAIDKTTDTDTESTTTAATAEGTSGGPAGPSTVAVAWERAREWVLTSRVRVFGSAAAATALLMLISLAIPSTAISLFFAALWAAITMILALLAIGTWWADRTGRTDSTDLWDAGPADNARPTDLFEGFGFTEDSDTRPR